MRIDYLKCLRALGLVASVLLAGCNSKSEADSIASAQALLAKHDPGAALVELKSALQANQNSSMLRYLMGVALLEQGDGAAALVELAKAREAGHEESVLIPKFAHALVVAGKSGEALSSYGRTSLTEPGAQAELRTAIAVAHARAGKADLAVAAVGDALKASPGYPWALLTKARLMAAQGDFDGAATLIKPAMVEGDLNGDAWYLSGFLHQYGKRDLKAAEKAYLEASKDPRQRILARTALVNLYIGQRRLPDLKAIHAAMAKSHPAAISTAITEAQIASIENDMPRAREVLDKVLRRVPDDPRLLVFSASIDIRNGNLLSAESQLGKAVQLAANFPLARKLLAANYVRMGQPDKALAALRPMLESGRADAEVHSLAGEANLQKGDPVKADGHFVEAVKLRPGDVNLRTAVALSALVRGQGEAALDSLQAIAAGDSGETADLALISARMKRQEFDAALSAIAALEQKLPGKATPALLRGQALRQKGDAAGARAAFEAALKAQPNHSAAVLNLAMLDAASGKPEAARSRLEALLKANPKDSAARLGVVELMTRQGADVASIRALLADGIKENPTDVAARIALIDSYINGGENQQAMDAAQAAQIAVPDNPEILDALGRVQALRGDVQQAISTFNRIAILQPHSPGPHLRLAEVHARAGNQTARAASLRKAFDVAPESAQLHRQLLSLAAQTKDPRPALAMARELQKSRPAQPGGFVLEGDLEAGRGNWSAALSAYRKVLALENRPNTAAVSVYVTLARMGRSAEAEQFATDWRKKHPKDAAFLTHLGSVAMARKDLARAEKLYAEVLTIDPNSVLALNNVAWLLAERGAKDALAMAERAASLAPGSSLVLDTLAHALAADGQYKRAVEVQKNAVAFATQKQDYRLHLAQIYLKSGDKAAALAELTPLAALKDKSATARKAGELLESIKR